MVTQKTGGTKKPTKNAMIRLRCTAVEYNNWKTKAQASGMSISALIRESLDRARTWTPQDAASERERLRHLARIGNNLNQLARWVNTYKSSADAVPVCSHLAAVERILQNMYRRGKGC